jgi:hypothetical protein
MYFPIHDNIREAAMDLASSSCAAKISSSYGMDTEEQDADLLNKTLSALSKMPAELVKDCGIKVLEFEDMGRSEEFFPNHGYYVNNRLVLNSMLTEDPKRYQDASGSIMDKFEQTLYHELGHGWDDCFGNVSEQEEWLNLSGWSKEYKTGLKRIIIEEPGQEKVVGEWCFDPSCGFTRFYAKRNPWDDFADSFAYYVAGCKSFLPKNKIEYFDKYLGKYYQNQAENDFE